MKSIKDQCKHIDEGIMPFFSLMIEKMTHKGSLFPIFIIFILLSGTNKTFSQSAILTQKEAVEITLKNNYNIQIAENDVEVAQNNTRKGPNGYLPSVNASANANSSLGSSRQKFSNGNENVVDNSFNWGSNGSVGVNYTLVDLSRDKTLKQLKEIASLSDLQLRQIVENNLLEVFSNYFEVARLTQNANVLEQTLEVSEQRLLRAKYQYDYGQGLRLNVLNAEVDVKRDSINLLNINNQLSNAKRNLNFAMGRVVTTSLEVDTTVIYQSNLTLDQLVKDALTNNVLISLIEKNLDITASDLAIIQASRLPTLGANASFDFNFSDNAPGSFIDLSTSRGLAAGLSLSWNIFDGGRRKLQRDNTYISIESQRIQKQQLLQQLERDILNAWESYQNALFILKAEEKNLSTNQLNFQRTEEQFKVGQITSVEFRQAQINLLTAATNYNSAKYDAKIIELQLIQLSGGLLDLAF